MELLGFTACIYLCAYEMYVFLPVWDFAVIVYDLEK